VKGGHFRLRGAEIFVTPGVKKNFMGKRKRRGKLNWRSKRANKGKRPNLGN